MIMLRSRDDYKEYKEDSKLYLIDTEKMELIESTSQNIIDKLKSGEYVYESEKHMMPGLEVEDKE